MKIILLHPDEGSRSIRDAAYRMLAYGMLPAAPKCVESWLAERGVRAKVLTARQVREETRAMTRQIMEAHRG
jgi:hypothetical protein